MGLIKTDNTDRFLRFVNKTGTCWLWTGGNNGVGYGKFSIKHKPIYAHRYSYATYKGAIPEGYEIDHLCKVVSCVNPDHLEAVTPHLNSVRGRGMSKKSGLPPGVSTKRDKFRTQLRGVYIGTFNTVEQARNAYLNAGGL